VKRDEIRYEVRRKYARFDPKKKETHTFTPTPVAALDIYAARRAYETLKSALEADPNVEIVYIFAVRISPNGRERRLLFDGSV